MWSPPSVWKTHIVKHLEFTPPIDWILRSYETEQQQRHIHTSVYVKPQLFYTLLVMAYFPRVLRGRIREISAELSHSTTASQCNVQHSHTLVHAPLHTHVNKISQTRKTSFPTTSKRTEALWQTFDTSTRRLPPFIKAAFCFSQR